METHPSFAAVSGILSKYPRAAGVVYQAYNDLLYTQQWADLEIVELSHCQRAGFRGRRPESEKPSCVVPCSLAESLSIAWLKSAYAELGDPEEIFLAILADDSSIVYYKLSKGLTKPPI
ncbi:uncharacterized protein STEHIDRAFT_67816 [Stereum hirsutum FP-91666 SS1]|uniref:uncharacterized protein n=1 Tax=Stereum hirsutum (strain FP-91666) TaxID=721885 RepID=UPI000444A31B|nr:uncharacterized protein STEHIDRAFT_67816 [Stereum hirsutum FP-91666 SS1]EIM80789.1 hypothetical protein STEHIDRAFT_67816 [Stereum hirsutum FP-91666 SS1]